MIVHGRSPRPIWIPANRFGFSRHRDTIQAEGVERQEGQIVQSRLNLRDFLCAPWKGALSLRVRIPPGSCRSSR